MLPHAGGRRCVLDDDRTAVAPPARGKRAVVEEQVDARPRDHRRELLEEFRRVAHCGLCHFDLSIADGTFPSPMPIVLDPRAYSGTVL